MTPPRRDSNGSARQQKEHSIQPGSLKNWVSRLVDLEDKVSRWEVEAKLAKFEEECAASMTSKTVRFENWGPLQDLRKMVNELSSLQEKNKRAQDIVANTEKLEPASEQVPSKSVLKQCTPEPVFKRVATEHC